MIQRKTSTGSPRRGAAAVEFAVCLPLLFTLVFGSLQACNLLFLKQGLTTAVYEGTLEASKAEATRESVRSRAESILAAYGIRQATIDLSPPTDLRLMAPGTELTITVSAPTGPNVAGPEIATPHTHFTSSGVMMR